jgi:methylated-DNA-[protein]-cysteine S-methyltransferase
VHRRNEAREDEPSEPEAAIYGSLLVPIGLLWVAARHGGIVAVEADLDEAAFAWEVARRCGAPVRFAPGALSASFAQLHEYFAGTRRRFDLTLDFGPMSDFRRRVLEATVAIPWGETRTYGEIARVVGRPGAARAVGTAMATCPMSIVIPCHRVVRADGSPGAYSNTGGACAAAQKRILLRLEGVPL